MYGINILGERRIVMGERQAKKNRKNVEKVEGVKKTVDKSTVIMNIILTAVIIAVLALGAYTLAPKFFNTNLGEKAQVEQPTVADFIEEKGITLDEFKAEYGLGEREDITEESFIDELSYEFSLDNYAKYQEKTVEELKEEYGLSADVDNSTKWSDAIGMMTTKIVAEKFFGSDFESFRTQMGLPEDVKGDMLWSETEAIAEKMYAEQQATKGSEGE